MRRFRLLLVCLTLALASHACSPDVAAVRQRAENGDAPAQLKLASLYATGRGAPKDLPQAAVWYRQAADQGQPDAMYLLGLMCGAGQGVPRDFAESYKWLSIAVARASADKQNEYSKSRDEIASWLTPPQLVEAQRRASDWSAAFEQRVKK